MQTCIGLMDEVAKLFEHVEIDIPNPSTVTLSVTVPATVLAPVGNIMHDGLDGSRWDLCGPKDLAVEKVKGHCHCVSHGAVDGSRENYEARFQVFVSTGLMRPVWSRSSSDAARASRCIQEMVTQIVFMTWRAYHVCFDSAVLVSVFFATHEGIMGTLWWREDRGETTRR